MSAVLDILGLDPTAPQVPAAARKPATVAAPVAAKANTPTAAAAASSSARPALPARPQRATSSSTTNDDVELESFAQMRVAAGANAAPASQGSANSTLTITPPHSAPSTAHFNRARWVEHQLALRASEFTETKELLLFAGTWNVNAKKPRDEADLGPWLLHRIKCKGGKAGAEDDADSGDEGAAASSGAASTQKQFKAPDIYVIGFQEIVDLNAGNLLVDHRASEPWEQFILRTLERTGKTYCKVTTVHLVGLSMVVFVKEKHLSAVSDVRVDDVGVGIMGVGGNKGAVLVKMKIYKTVFCFINSHLAAHQGAVKARNADYWNICRRASFEGSRKARIKSSDGEWIDPEEHRRRLQPANSGSSASMDNFAASASSLFDSGMSKFKTIMDNVSQNKKSKAAASASASAAAAGEDADGSPDNASPDSSASISLSAEDLLAIRTNPHGIFGGSNHVVWMGDNNYRLNVVEYGMQPTHDLISSGNWPALLKFDQLLLAKQAKQVFLGFTEPKITFAPTYKFVAGTSSYDRREDKKVRFPAYTDRIQFQTVPPPKRPGSLQALQVSRALGQSDLELNTMHPLFYASTWDLTASDHKPVMCLLEAPIVFEREKSRRKIVDELEQLHDEECLPKLALSTKVLEFGLVPFEFPMTRTFQIRNAGDAVVAFRIMHQNLGLPGNSPPAQTRAVGLAGQESAGLTKPWMRISPQSGILALGATLTIHVTIHVTSRSGSAQLLNSDAENLACELLLRLDGGFLYKIPLAAQYEKSLCGSELSYLNALPTKSIRDADPADVLSNDTAYALPHFLFKLVDYMQSKKGILTLKQNAFVMPAYQSDGAGEDEDEEEEDEVTIGDDPAAPSRRRLAAAGLAVRNGVPQQVCTAPMRWILDYLDNGRSLDKEPRPGKWKSPAAPAPTEAPGELPAAAFWHTFLYFLASLPSPLLVASTSQRWVNGMDLTAWCLQTMLETEVDKYRTLVREGAKRGVQIE